MERLVPECMKPNSSTTTAASDSATDAPSQVDAQTQNQVTSRVENVVEGVCPLCKRQMKVSTANGVPVNVCMEHSLVMPVRDQELLDV